MESLKKCTKRELVHIYMEEAKKSRSDNNSSIIRSDNDSSDDDSSDQEDEIVSITRTMESFFIAKENDYNHKSVVLFSTKPSLLHGDDTNKLIYVPGIRRCCNNNVTMM